MRLRFALLAALCLGMPAAPTYGDSEVQPGPGGFYASGSSALDGSQGMPLSTSVSVTGTWHNSPACEAGGLGTCAEPMTCADGSQMTQWWLTDSDGTIADAYSVCDDDVAEEPTEITPSMALRALRRVPLPESVLTVQPPNGRTLVNFDTNFFTEAAPFDRTVRILGQRVDLRIWPSAFTWHFGDGTTRTTSEPGAPYPRLDVTHAYLRKGRVSPSVDTTYSADFRVNGGPWRPVTGTVTMAGAPETLEVVTARPTLVGHSR